MGLMLSKLLEHYPEFVFHAFEPNIELHAQIECNVLSKFPDRKLYLHNYAAWIYDGFMNMHMGPPIGGTLVPDKRVPSNFGRPVDYSFSKTVKCCDFGYWLLTHVRPSDTCYIKLDIEGAEYPLIESLFIDGSIFLIDRLYVEWHDKMLSYVTDDYQTSIVKRLKAIKSLDLVDWRAGEEGDTGGVYWWRSEH